MSAFQNKAVNLIREIDGENNLLNHAEARTRLLKSMLALYRATGGTREELAPAAQRMLGAAAGHDASVDACMGDLLQALAVLGHLHDIDIIQAGYNTMEAQMRSQGSR